MGARNDVDEDDGANDDNAVENVKLKTRMRTRVTTTMTLTVMIMVTTTTTTPMIILVLLLDASIIILTQMALNPG